MKKVFLRRIAPLVAAAAVLLSMISCTKKYDFPESTEEEKQTVLLIGDVEVPFEQYRYFFMNYKFDTDGGSESFWSGMTDDEISAEFARIDALTRESLLRLYATLDLALDHEIDYHSGKIQKAVTEKLNDQIENDFGGLDGYLSSLGEVFMTSAVHRFLLAELECEGELYNDFVEDGTIGTDDETIMGAISGGEFCRAKQILIKNDRGDDIEQNRLRAEELLERARSGEDFDMLVAKYGEDPEMITSPVGYYFTHGELIEEFEDAAFALEEGEISDIVSSSVGFHIIMRCPLDPAYVAENYESLAEAYLTSLYFKEVTERLESMSFTETDLSRSLSMDDFKYPAR